MRIYITDGTRTVQLSTSPRERTDLKTAEKTARRLFAALPGPPQDKPKTPIGFAGSVQSDTEIAPEPAPQLDETDGDDE
ncbi:hypothetical protein [Streptomyces sp. NPDC056069]|uniref:hypothetical protein n=1 Tax=Streptomyces sp. NPDC056069 TaxID=3345702 RepID=UPI0035DA41FA